MDKRPKVSVIIPIYNVESYLSRCLESVVNQTLLDIEIIGVNDGTKDNSVQIIREYMALDHRISLVEKENGGLASARNAGLKVSSGEIVLFLDSDDYLAENACERIYEEYLNHGADIIVFGSTPFPEIPEPDEWVVWKLNCHDIFYPEFEPDVLFKEPCGLPFAWNRAFARDFLVKNHLQFPEDVLFGEDIVFLFEATPQANSIQFIEDKLHFYQCFRQGSLMFRYNGEIEKKMRQHIRNMGIITAYWYKRGWIAEWGKDYFEWFISFIVPDLIQYEGENRDKLARAALKIMNRYSVNEWKKKAKFEFREKYRRLIRMAKVK
ncbi:glycosyltransferase family 2 protein [Frisingicoccus sp.]|uniref:glycosyltransferase family 2 protein n=1 Tax=Frisingicoccus sp. TaxID=1918627 RepID=UPI00262DB23A|nr:glycosyltransferase family 2 protein [Frisingicoccus sp.]MDD6232726.1 glycosyltransferase family 2 protein [Frisingicoccus sp.]MDY4834401.1 glycosyltransferase family 2 protein [Frisingicoccus sp.]MDY4922405.1 glycosyltransferase family 2 protein [Frisingicoccus sp.]